MQTNTSKAIADWRAAVARNAAAAEAVSQAAPGIPGFAALQTASRQAIADMQKLARDAWKAPVSGWADIVLRAEIAQAAYWPDHHGEGVRQLYALFGDPADEDISNFGERAIVHLLKAILGPGVEEPAEGRPEPAQADAGSAGVGDAPPADGLLHELDEMLAKARQGVTTLRTVVQGWEAQHGPHRPFDDGDGGFLASLDFCADGIEATVNLISERIATAAGWESD